MEEAHRRFAPLADGERSGAYPALATADPGLFGVSIVGVSGATYEAGDSDASFTIMSVSKPFTFAVVCEAIGPDSARAAVGVNATGLAFNAIEAVQRSEQGRTNPMVNPGAIAAVGLVPGSTADERWAVIHDYLSAFAGRSLALDDDTYRAAGQSRGPNRAIAEELQRLGVLSGAVEETLDLYNRQCCLTVTAHDLAVMGATLADGGVNPVTGARVVSAVTCRHTLAVMATAGLYETSGDWLYDVGMPAKSGIAGGLVTVAPGKGALGTYSPPLDPAGNSVRGRRVATFLGDRLGLDLFASAPATEG